MYESLVFSARLRHSRETEQDIIFAFVREVSRKSRMFQCKLFGSPKCMLPEIVATLLRLNARS